MLEPLLLLLLGCCAGLHRDSAVSRLRGEAAPMWHHQVRQSSSTAWQNAPCAPSLGPQADLCLTTQGKPTDTTAALLSMAMPKAPLLAGGGQGIVLCSPCQD